MRRRFFIILTLVIILLIIGFTAYNSSLKKHVGLGKLSAGEDEFTGTLYELISKGGNKTCTWEETTGSGKTSETITVSSDKFALIIQSESSGIGQSTRIVGDGEKLYSWFDFNSPGVSMTYDNLKNPSYAQENGLLFKKNKYVCTNLKETPDQSHFEIPKNVKFN